MQGGERAWRVKAAVLQAQHELRLAAHQEEHHIAGRAVVAACVPAQCADMSIGKNSQHMTLRHIKKNCMSELVLSASAHPTTLTCLPITQHKQRLQHQATQVLRSTVTMTPQ